MAQETAGTIGIPVLKNEVLPYLTDYAKRQERAELYRQKAEARAADLAAKKAAEVDKYIPPAFDIAKGGYWQPAIKKRMEEEQAVALKRISEAKTPAEKAKAAQDYNTILGELNYGGEQETQRQKENLKALQSSGYNVDEDALARYYGEQAQTNKDFFTTNHINNFKKWAQSQPEKYVSPASIGTSLLKQYEPISIDITGKTKGEKFVYNPLFEPERVKDPLTGVNVYRANKANLVKLQEALEANPNIREAAEAYIQPIANRIKAASPGMSNTEAYALAAEDFFSKAMPQGRAKEAYDYSEVKRGRGGAGRSSKTPVSIESLAGPRSVDFPTYSLNDINKPFNSQQATIGNADPKNPDKQFAYSKEYNFGANVPVYLMQDPEDVKLGDKRIFNMYFGQRPDGTYTLKNGFKYSNPIRSTVYFAKNDIRFGNSKYGYIVKKGTPLDNETAANLIRQNRGKDVGLERGYEVTANMAVPYEIEESDLKAGQTTRERVRPSIKLFIPEANAGAIKSHINMEMQKANSFEAPSETLSGEYRIFQQ